MLSLPNPHQKSKVNQFYRPLIHTPKPLDQIIMKAPKMLRKQQLGHYLMLIQKLIEIEQTSKTILKIIIPQICILKKANPQLIINKKKENQSFKTIRNKEKLNFYQVKNFFVDSFIYHNQCIMQGEKNQLSKRKQKSQLIKSSNFQRQPLINANGQLLCLPQIQNLFKSSKRIQRLEISYFKTFIKSIESKQCQIKVQLPDVIQEPIKYPSPSQKFLQQLSLHILFITYSQLGFKKGMFVWVRGPKGWILTSFVGIPGQVQLPTEYKELQNKLQKKMRIIIEQQKQNTLQLKLNKFLQNDEEIKTGISRWMTILQNKWQKLKEDVDIRYQSLREINNKI